MSSNDVEETVPSTKLSCCVAPLLLQANPPRACHVTSGTQHFALNDSAQSVCDSSIANQDSTSKLVESVCHQRDIQRISNLETDANVRCLLTFDSLTEFPAEINFIEKTNLTEFQPVSEKQDTKLFTDLNTQKLVKEISDTCPNTPAGKSLIEDFWTYTANKAALDAAPSKDAVAEREANCEGVIIVEAFRPNTVFESNFSKADFASNETALPLELRTNQTSSVEVIEFAHRKDTGKTYDSDSEQSISSGGTLQNCDILSEDDFLEEPVKSLNAIQADSTDALDMGNKSGKTGTYNVEDDLGDGRTRCCEIPKKKVKEVKEKTTRANRSSRCDDLAFESNEVYPFEGRARSEQELVEPVELEPFEIVETDYFKFVPGAGTSEIIKSAAEARNIHIATIPEETTIPEENTTESLSVREGTESKVPFYVDRGSRLPEAGTSTAHSTFEFRQVKTKHRAIHSSQPQHTYENVDVSSPSQKAKKALPSEPKASTSTSQSSPGASRKEINRQNSNEAVQKPSRKGKSKAQSSKTDEALLDNKTPGESVADNAAVKPKTETNLEKKPSIRDSEIERNINSVLVLTQTMFSQSKTTNENKAALPNKEIDETVPVIQYENVGVCAKLEPTGIAIGHKSVLLSKPKTVQSHPASVVSRINTESSNQTKNASKAHSNITSGESKIKTQSKITSREPKIKPSCSKVSESSKQNRRKFDDDDSKKTNAKERKEARKELSYDIIEISDTGTLIIKSLADLPSAESCKDGNCVEAEEEEKEEGGCNQEETCEEKEEFRNEETNVKKPFETAENGILDNSDIVCPDITITKDQNAETDGENKKDVVDKEHVPPPSPQAMLILEEEEEEEDDFEWNEKEIELEENARRKSEIEFSETVFKRLSQLLENNPEEYHAYENDDDDDERSEDVYLERKDTDTHEYETCAYTNHIYETIDGSGRIVVSKPNKTYDDREFLSEPEVFSQDSNLQLQDRSGSSSTLKRASGESQTAQDKEFETYQSKKTRVHSDSSDDGLPDFFDPRDIPPPQLDSDFITDNFNTLEADSGIGKPNKSEESVTSHEVNRSGKIKSNGDKPGELPLNVFDSDLLNETPATGKTEDLQEITPTADAQPNLTALPELANVEEEIPAVQFDTSGRQSVTCTESDLDTSEHRDDLSTDSMLADDEAEETMEILFTKTYTEPVEGAEVFLSCTVVNSAYKDDKKKSDTWLSDEAFEYFEANASEVMSTAFIKAKREMKDIQICLQSLRRQMEHFHSDCDDVSLPDLPGPEDSYSPDYFGIPKRRAITE